jgi:hypothetical protein
MLHHYKAPGHMLLLVHEFLAKHETTVVPQLPYSPDLALADFPPPSPPKLKSTLKSRQFWTLEEIEENSLQGLRAVPQNVFQNWKKQKRCIDSGGEYFEGDKSY